MHRRRVGKVAQRNGDVARERPAHADVDRPVDDDDVARPRERLAQGLGRERPEGDEGNKADRDPVGAHLVDHVLDRAVDRAHRDDQRLGVLGLVGPEQSARLAAEALLEIRSRASSMRASAVCCLKYCR